MIGIILAGGKGSRLAPLTNSTNKHMLEVNGKPMIQHSIEKFQESGITKLIIVTGEEFAGDILNFVGSGRRFGVDVTFKVQDTANGIAGALELCENIIKKNERFIVMLGDNIFIDPLKKFAKRGWQFGSAKVWLKEVDNPRRFGVAEFDSEGNLVGIEEKPKNPKSNHAVTGIYMFDTKIFDYIKLIEPSKRGELEIADVLNHYLHDGALEFGVMQSAWSDAGTHESLAMANLMFEPEFEVSDASLSTLAI